MNTREVVEEHIGTAIHHLEQAASAWKDSQGGENGLNAIDSVANMAEDLYQKLKWREIPAK